MLVHFFDKITFRDAAFIGALLGFVLNYIFLAHDNLVLKFFPQDQGREFAVNGEKSKGKIRGVGLIFVIQFVVVTLLFGKVTTEICAYLLILLLGMMTGYLDDAAKTPWNEYKKAIWDFIIAVLIAVTYIGFNGTTINIISFGKTFEMNKIVMGILIVILVWVSINVTNCSDGVDGLCGSLAVYTIATIAIITKILNVNLDFILLEVFFIAIIMSYLMFNVSPSKVLMGDAGSRAIGLFVSIAILKTKAPLLYLLVAFVFIIDGGTGLVKVSLKRFLKISILKNIRTPLHDNERKNRGWSDTQVVYRYSVLQIMLSLFAIYLCFR